MVQTHDKGALRGPGDPSPIHVPGERPPVLALHGYTSTPQEVRLVVEVAKELGLEVYAPLLPGHGTHARDLARTGWSDWSRAAAAALDAIAPPSGTPALVVGLSLGSLLGAYLAATRPAQVRALAMLANAIRFLPLTKALPLWILAKLRVPDFDMPKRRSDIADPEGRANHLAYGVNPLCSTIAVMRAGQQTEREFLPQIRCPVFIAHGKHDHVCPVSNATRAARCIPSLDETVVILANSRHVITEDYDREILRAELRGFFQRVGAGHTPG